MQDYITTYTNMKYYLPSLPKITCEEKNVFSLTIPADGLTQWAFQPVLFGGTALGRMCL